jgi:PAS domain S-box-containing protein
LASKGLVARSVFGVACAVVATALRALTSPIVHAQVPFILFVVGVVVATWGGRRAGGAACAVCSAIAGNYFFVAPTYTFKLHYSEGFSAVILFAVVAAITVWQVDRWREVERSLRVRDEELTTLLDNSPDAVIRVDRALRNTYSNAMADQAFHLPAGNLPGRVADEVRIPGEIGDELIRRLRSEIGTGRAETAELTSVLDGRLTAWEARFVPEFSGDGSIQSTLVVARDITARKHAEHKVLELVELLDLAPILVRDVQDRITHWNTGAQRLYGFSAAEAVGQVSHELLRTEFPEPYEALRRVLLRTGRWEGDLVHTRADGARLEVKSEWVVQRDPTGSLLAILEVNSDITERRRLEAELRRTADELAEASRAKDQFLGTLSHELRTPLNAIIGWADILVRGGLPADQARRAQEAILRNAQAQGRLIEDVLDVSRIISGKLPLNARPTDVVRVVTAAVESLQVAADAKGVQVRTEIASGPATVHADPDRLQQVFWNLLSNAVKFTPAGGQVTISISSTGSTVQVAVEDTGIGISHDFLPHVFERFRQVDSSSTRVHGGLGLGLAIVKQLIELHGGTVKAESPGENGGTRLTVALPVRRPEGDRHQQASASSGEMPSLSGVCVLVIDDDLEAREVTAAMLTALGASVVPAASAADALAKLRSAAPDVLLVDIAMPNMDGYALLRRIREDGGPAADVPAIAVTAFASRGEAARALAAGFFLHVAKPANASALARAIRQACEASRAGTHTGVRSPAR